MILYAGDVHKKKTHAVDNDMNDEDDTSPWKPDISAALAQLRSATFLSLSPKRRKLDIQHCGFLAKINLGEILFP